jgi:hypothetical protein
MHNIIQDLFPFISIYSETFLKNQLYRSDLSNPAHLGLDQRIFWTTGCQYITIQKHVNKT